MPRPTIERCHHVAYDAARRLVGQLALLIELGLRLTDQHLRLVERVHVEKYHAAAQVALRAGSASHTGASAEDGAGLSGKWLVGWTRSQPLGPASEKLRPLNAEVP